MKKLFLAFLVIVFLIGCRDTTIKADTNPRDYYHSAWAMYIDSSSYYFEKFVCCYGTNNVAAEVYKANQFRYSDSANRYYALMYPNGNPADKQDPKPPCDCK